MTLVELIHQTLTVHCQLEEELIYPAFQEHAAMQARVSKALQEHELARMLLAEFKELRPDDTHYDAKVRVLIEYMRGHFSEEEQGLFVEAPNHISQQELERLGDRVEARRRELLTKGEIIEEKGVKHRTEERMKREEDLAGGEPVSLLSSA